MWGKPMQRSFWKDALGTMHPSVRERYAPYFRRAEEWERTFDAALALWRELRRTLSWLLFRAARHLHPDLH
jgi:hypothetical protein